MEIKLIAGAHDEKMIANPRETKCLTDSNI